MARSDGDTAVLPALTRKRGGILAERTAIWGAWASWDSPVA